MKLCSLPRLFDDSLDLLLGNFVLGLQLGDLRLSKVEGRLQFLVHNFFALDGFVVQLLSLGLAGVRLVFDALANAVSGFGGLDSGVGGLKGRGDELADVVVGIGSVQSIASWRLGVVQDRPVIKQLET